MRKRSSKGGGAQRSIQVHLMVNEEEAAMIRAAARKRNQTHTRSTSCAPKASSALFLASKRPFSVSPAPSAHPTNQRLQMASSALSIAQPSTSCTIALKKSFMPVHMRRLELLPIHGMAMGVASAVIGYPITRFAVRIGLLGRPRPHGRLRLQAARAACATTVFHLCDRGVTLVSTLLWRCCFGDLRAAARA